MKTFPLRILAHLRGVATLALFSAFFITAAARAELPQLKVSGNKIINDRGETVLLKGVNTASMEWDSHGEGHILQTVSNAIHEWHVNIIRLPLTQDRWFGKAPEQRQAGQEPYRALVKQIVNYCASNNCYIILDLHWNDCNLWGTNIGQHSMPDLNSVEFWKDFAAAYANHPAVLFDLYNEPHDVTWDVWLKGGKITDKPNVRSEIPNYEYECVGMQKLLDTVRAAGAKNVVVAGGLGWASDLSGIVEGRRLSDPGGYGVIYANHHYMNDREPVDKWVAHVEAAAAKFPVIVSEFGPSTSGRATSMGPADPRFLELMRAIAEHHWSFTAWDMHPAAGPVLISDWNYTPTPGFGAYVKQLLDGTFRYAPPPPTTNAPAATPGAQ